VRLVILTVLVVLAAAPLRAREQKFIDGLRLLSSSAFEMGIPALESWENVVRMRKSLDATDAKPMDVFLTLTNGTIVRMYPFRVDRPEEPHYVRLKLESPSQGGAASFLRSSIH